MGGLGNDEALSPASAPLVFSPTVAANTCAPELASQNGLLFLVRHALTVIPLGLGVV